MANKDDEILGGGGQDFSSDDLSIPDDRDNTLDEAEFENSFNFDEDVLMAEAELIENHEDDSAHDNHYDEHESPSEYSSSAEHELDEQLAEYEESGNAGEHLDDDTTAANPPASLGWKAWTGLAVVAIAVAGGLGVMVWPDSPKQQPLASAPPVQAIQAPQNATPIASAPVNVQAFPTAPASAPETGRSMGDGANNTGGMAPGGSGGNGMSDDGGGSVSVIPDPADQQPLPEEPAYLASIAEDRAAFKSVSELADKNLFRLEQLRKRFDRYSASTDSELEDLDRRVTALEKQGLRSVENKAKNAMPQNGSNTRIDNRANQADESDNSTGTFVYKVPKTPAEIKELQRTLRDFGYRPGKVDGILGGQTRWAIKRFQEEHGLPVDGWLSAETMKALQDPKRYSGTYPAPKKTTVARKNTKKQPVVAMASPTGKTFQWYVRGVTPTKAVVYRQDGLSYPVSVGSEIPGMGQVVALDPAKHEVRTAQGTIGKR